MTVIPFRSRSTGKRNSGSENAAPAFREPPRGVPAVGIDLGTTNSVASVFSPEQEHPRSLEFDGHPLVPSMILFNPENGSLVVGAGAREHLAHDASDVVRSTKRDMGTPGRSFVSGGRSFTAEESAREVLRYLASHEELDAARTLGNGTLWSVITVPAHFDDAARQATLASAREAGLEVMRIINEPTAAALAYSMLPDVRSTEHELLAVFDLGGGTFDVSVVEREGLVFNVLSSEGDVALGGDDFDTAIARALLSRVTPQLTARRAGEDSEMFRTLLVHAEAAKKALQEEGEVHIQAEDLDGKGASLNTIFTRDDFEEIAAPLVRRTLELTERAIHSARKRPSQISRILLVGGSTRVTLVQKMLQSYFPGCLVDSRLEPDLAVSWGASVQAAIILGIEPSTILVDVCSHTLGIGVAEDSRAVTDNFKEVCKRFGILQNVDDTRLAQLLGPRLEEFNRELQSLLRVAPIIHRNSPLPARKSEFFSTLYHNQAAVQVVVVQGEEEVVGRNRLIGSFLFGLEQPCPAGTRCEIQLTYDVNGMVHVRALQLGTENEAEAEFDSRTGEVKGWVREDEEEPADVEAEAEAEAGAATASGEEPIREVTASAGEARIIPVAFGTARALSAVPGKGDAVGRSKEAADADILNGLLLRVRRRLARDPVPAQGESESLGRLRTLEDTYASLLRNAKNGEDNDAALEAAEDELLALLEALP